MANQGLREEVWLSRLAKATNIELETCHVLWGALLQQIDARLALGYALNFGALGYWIYDLRDEFVAQLPSEIRYLIPPATELCISHNLPENVAEVGLVELVDSIVSMTGITATACRGWVQRIDSLAMELIQVGRELTLPGVGILYPNYNSLGTVTGFRLSVAAALNDTINKAFVMFAPVELLSEAAAEGLRVVQTSDLEELMKPKEVEFMWASEGKSPMYTGVKEALEVDNPTTEIREDTQTATDLAPSSTQIQEDTGESSLAPKSLGETLFRDGECTEREEAEISESEAISSQALTHADARSRWRMFVSIWVLIALVFIGVWFIRSVLSVYSNVPTQAQMETEFKEIILSPSANVGQRDTLVTSDSSQAASSVSMAIPNAEEHLGERPSTRLEVNPEGQLAGDDRGLEAEIITLKNGIGLMQISLRKYGDKVFWVYIYEENKAIISDFNNIPLGTQLTLPAARKYGIDANDTNSRNRALALQRALLGQRRQ